MGATNFHSENNIAIFAIEVEEADAGESVRDTEEYARELLAENKSIKVYDGDDRDTTENSNYPSHVFASVMGATEMGYSRNYIVVQLITRSGYNAGANLDYVSRVHCAYDGDYYDMDEINNVQRATAMGGDISATEIKRLESQARRLENIVAKAFTKITTPVVVKGIFSNGEAVYEKLGN